jgi:hypothetical protein
MKQKLPIVMYDCIIQIFLTTKHRRNWRKMISTSKLWPSVAEGTLKRTTQLALENAETKLNRSQLIEMKRVLTVLTIESMHYNNIIHDFSCAIPSEYDALLAKYRIYLNDSFFEHIEYLAVAATRDGLEHKSETLISLKTKIFALISAFDHVLKKSELIEDAIERLQNLLNTASSFDDFEMIINVLATKDKIDPALLFVISRAYSSVNESQYINKAVADSTMYIYFRTKELISKSIPPEVRILKHLLTFENESEIKNELERALETGPHVETVTHEYISTSPDMLLKVMDVILETYDKSCYSVTSSSNSFNLQPIIIDRLVTLRKMLINRYIR